MAGKRIINSRQAREGILQGILEACQTASKTYGPRGRTVAYDKGGSFITTKDGITVLRNINFTDEMKNFGVKLLRESSSKSNYHSGDGSTGVAILTSSLCHEANKLLNQGLDINAIKEGFKQGKEFVLKELKNYVEEVKDEKDIYNIAKVSANGDDEIAKFVTEAFTQIGDNGIVTISVSQSRKGETAVKISTGIEFDKGYVDSKSVNSSNDQCIIKNPNIFLSLEPLNDPDELKPILDYCSLQRLPLVVIAPNFDETVMAVFQDVLTRGIFEGGLIFAPGSDKKNIENKINDLAVLLDTKVFGQDFNLDEFNSDKHFGKCEEIIITKNKTTIIDPNYKEEVLQKYVETLQEKVKMDSADQALSEYEISMIKDRIARMTGGVATIYVGALTEIELNEKKDRYEDSVNAVRASIDGGFITGASTPLLRIASTDELSQLSDAVFMAMTSYLRCMKSPAKLLISSTGKDPDAIIPKVLKEEKDWGFNAKTAQIENLKQLGIIDPYKVIYNSVLYASNIAEQFVTIDAVIISDVKNLSLQNLDEILSDDGVSFNG